MAKTKSDDRNMLRALLEAQGELTDREAEAFQSMWDRLESGRVSTLSNKQREWVESIYFKLKLDRNVTAENLVSSGKVGLTPADKAWLKQYCGERPDKPLKPPGVAQNHDRRAR